MKRRDRQKVSHAILHNVGVHGYCLVDAAHLIVLSLNRATSQQVIAGRVAAAICSGRLELDVASVLGFV